jgi:dTDP-4-dehydrorhamnose reductase
LARLALRLAGLDEAQAVARSADSFGWAAERPRYSVLGSAHGALLPSVENALLRYLAEEPLLQVEREPAMLVE